MSEPILASQTERLVTLLQSDRATEEDWHAFAARFEPLLLTTCKFYGLARDEYEDVRQSVFMTILKKLSQFKFVGNRRGFRPWLRKITFNHVLRCIYRRDGDLPRGVGGTEALKQLHEQSDSFDEAVDKADEFTLKNYAILLQAIEDCRQTCKPTTHRMVVMRYEEEVPVSEIAEKMGMEKDTVQRTTLRERKRIVKRAKELGYVEQMGLPNSLTQSRVR